MPIRNKNKDHLKDHALVEVVAPVEVPTSDDPLRFWTGHPTENTLVDLYEFADGASKTNNPTGGGNWSGSFSGRPGLILELATAIQVRLTLAAKLTCINYLRAIRKFWRTCDELEAIVTPSGLKLDRLSSVRDLTHLHETAMHRAKFERVQFGNLRNIVNDTRRLMGLGGLVWEAPKGGEPNRQIPPDSHAKALKIAIKRDWERVRKTWQRHDAIRNGEEPDTLNEYEKQNPATVQEYAEQNKILSLNWEHFDRIKTASVKLKKSNEEFKASIGKLKPTADELYEGTGPKYMRDRGLYLSTMRAIAFPTSEEAHIAFHAALIRSGWNLSTLVAGVNATLPENIFQHPKDTKQRVLAVESFESQQIDEGEVLEEFNMQGSKRRARGSMQFCMGLKKDPDSPPNIVAAYLERTRELRAQLHQDVIDAKAEYDLLKAQQASNELIESKFKRLQTLQQGERNVWLYVDYRGNINWIDGFAWKAFYVHDLDPTKRKRRHTYLELLTRRLNAEREKNQQDPIAVVTPSDFRDMYARWVYIQTNGNLIAVMIALGHKSLKNTDKYTDNNIFTAENDQAVRKFMMHLFDELAIGRLDLTILAQLVRHGPMTDEMLARLSEYRKLTRSRIKVACADIKNPPVSVDPEHVDGKRCGTHRCIKACPQARFLPESLDGIAMRVEELMVISDHMSIDMWIKGGFDKELEAGEYLLSQLYEQREVEKARAHWRERILSGDHVVPGVGILHQQEVA